MFRVPIGQEQRAAVSMMSMGCTASEVFLILTTQLYHFLVFFLFALLSDEPEVFLPKHSQILRQPPTKTFITPLPTTNKDNYPLDQLTPTGQ